MSNFSRLLFVLLLFVPFGAHAQSCKEYFTSEWANTLDMSDSTDILLNLTPNERSQLSDYSYSNGVFSTTTTGTDPWFKVLTRSIPGSIPDETTRYGDRKPIDTTLYKSLTIRMFADQPSALMAIWEKGDGTSGGSNFVTTSSGWNTYTIDLNVSNWASSPVYDLRIDPTQLSGASIMIDYIYLTPAGCTTPDLDVAPLRQPDREGGEDFFAAVRGNPANFDSPSDFEFISGNSSAAIYPSNAYTDSGGASRRGDYLEATNSSGDGDPVVHLIYPGTATRIDAGRYKIACYTLDILRSINEFHSLVRLFWKVDNTAYSTDDIVNKFTGEARYCFRMDAIQLEPALPTGQSHPWRNNSNGTGLDFFRLDPHEEDTPTSYRLTDVRLAADHEANKQFAIVVGGARTFPVELLYSVNSGPLQSIGILSAGRNSDVLLWNTEALAEGSYQVYSRSGSNTIAAGGLVAVEHSDRATDSTAPILSVDAPLSDNRFDTSLQIAGYALDNRRIAAIEAHIDGVLVDSFSPTDFDKRARDAYSNLPNNSTAGFDRAIDTSSIAAGAHTFTLTVYDTAGNTTVHSAQITKASSSLTPFVSIPFAEGTQQQVSNGSQPGSGGGGGGGGGGTLPAAPRLSVSARNNTVSVTATGSGASCTSLRLFTSATSRSKAAIIAGGTLLYSGSDITLRGSSKNVPRLVARRGATTIYFLTDCGAGTPARVKGLRATTITGRRPSSSLKKVFDRLVAGFKVAA